MKSPKILTLVFWILLPVIGLSQTQSASYYNVNSGTGRGLRFWSSDNYKISMGSSSEYKYGPVQDYSIKMNMNNDNDRGWTWGKLGQTPIAAISAGGLMKIKNNFLTEGSIGIGLNINSPRSEIHLDGGSSFPGIRFENYVGFTGKYWIEEMKAGQGGIYFYFGESISRNANINLTKSPFLIHRNGINLSNGRILMTSNPGVQIASNTYSGTMVDIDQAKKKIYFASSKFQIQSLNFKVTENGFLYARQIEVQATGNFPDYVFDDSYELRSLAEVEAFIKKNHHLPDVPSANEIEENGHNLAEIDEVLLKKIEELTLYIIELKKENESLSNRLENLEIERK